MRQMSGRGSLGEKNKYQFETRKTGFDIGPFSFALLFKKKNWEENTTYGIFLLT